MSEGLAERIKAMQAGQMNESWKPVPETATKSVNQTGQGDARRLQQSMLLAVPDRFAPSGFRAVRILRRPGTSEWFYEVVDPAALEPDALAYAQEVLRDLAN